MTQKEFLRKLKWHLFLWLNGKSTKAVLGDYEEYFATGRREGKNENALCREFGEPRLVALEILSEERGLSYKGHSSWWGLLGLLFPVGTYVCSILLGRNGAGTAGIRGTALLELWFLLVMPMLVVLLLGGRQLFLRPLDWKKALPLYVANGLALAGILTVSCALVNPAQAMDGAGAPAGLYALLGITDLAKMGPACSKLLALLGLVALCFFFYCSIFAMRENGSSVPLLFANSAMLLGCYRLVAMLPQLSEFNSMQEQLGFIVARVLLGFGVAILAALVVQWIGRRVSHGSANEKRRA